MPSIFWRNADRRNEKARQRERQLLAGDYAETFGRPEGQRVLAHILRRCGVFDTTFDANPTVAAFQEGRRRAALEILEMVNADPAAWQRMVADGQTEGLFDAPAE